MPIPRGFEEVPAKPDLSHRYGGDPPPDRPFRSGGVEVVMNDGNRKPKQPTVVEGSFKPSDFPMHGPGRQESIRLAGGQLHGQQALTARGSATYTRPVVGPGGDYQPASYGRTTRFDDEGLAVFEFQAA